MNDTITIDGVIYSADKKVLIKYPEENQEKTFYIPDFVEEIGSDCFIDSSTVEYIFIGNNVKKIGARAFGFYNLNIKKIFIPDSAVELVDEIFGKGVDDGGDFYFIDIVGGKKGSAIEKYRCQLLTRSSSRSRANAVTDLPRDFTDSNRSGTSITSMISRRCNNDE